MNKVRFCWLCGNKLWGNSSEKITIDNYEKTLHKKCAKQVKKEYDFKREGNQYFSLIWTTDDQEMF